MFIVVYGKIHDRKNKGIFYDGTFKGPKFNKLEEAHTYCKNLVGRSKFIILVKIYDLDETNEDDIIDLAKIHFHSVYDNMTQAAEILTRKKTR